MNKFFTTAAVCALTLGLAACDANVPQQSKNIQADKAVEAANSIKFNAGNAEIDNIKRRLELTADPALVGYIVLFNDMGRPILYTTIKGKVTSGGKRLTKPHDWEYHDCGQYRCTSNVDSPSDEGTFGSSNPYIYFWTTAGQYIQWSGNYLYSDKPIRVTDSPLVIIDEKKQ